MPSPLNIRDIGEGRKAALEQEAKVKGVSVAEIVRSWIDAGIAQSQAERAQAEWVAKARKGLADEARQLEEQGPNLSRFRSLGSHI